MESQQKEEAQTKVEALNGRVAELELQLQAQDTLEKMQSTEQKAAELQLQLETEAQQKHDAIEKLEMFELRVADLERQLEEQSHSQSEPDEQVCFHVPALWPHTPRAPGPPTQQNTRKHSSPAEDVRHSSHR